MGKSVYVSVAFGVLFSLQAMVHQEQLFGPEEKNRKVWESSIKGAAVMTTKRDQKMGPEAKNQKAWETTTELKPVEFSAKRKLTGGRAKNRRPERNNTNRMFDN